MKQLKWTLNFGQMLIGFLLVYLGHPYVGIVIAAIRF